jgi:hypothetical protein
MRVVELSAVRRELRRCFPQGWSGRDLIASERVLVLTRECFERSWVPYWAELKGAVFRAVDPKVKEAYFNPGMCEVFAEGARFFYSLMANREARARGWGDLQGGLWMAGVSILSGQLNGIEPDDHATALVALEESETPAGFTLYFWEPQNERELTTVESVCGGDPVRVLLRDGI